jgi:hypothetical protein
MGRTGFSWRRIGPVAGLCEHGNEPSGSIRKDSFWRAEWQSAFQVISCTMQWVSNQAQWLRLRAGSPGSVPGRSTEGIFFSFRHRVQTDSGVHPASASYPLGTGDVSLGVFGRAVNLTTHLHPLPRLGMHGDILTPPIRLHGLVLIKHGIRLHEVGLS